MAPLPFASRSPGAARSRVGALLLSLAAAAAPACTPESAGPDAGPTDGGSVRDGGPDAPIDEGPPRALFVVPRAGASTPFFDLPWPTDLRRTPAGTPDLSGFPNPRGVELLDEYIAAIEGAQRGFATNGAVYLRFSRAIDEGTLPASLAESVSAGASVFFLDVDPDSPDVGARHPAVVTFEDRRTIFWPGHCIALRPPHGVPLEGGRTYAAVVTTAVTQATGEPFARDDDFAALMDGTGDAAVGDARVAYRPAIDAVVAAGVAEDEILSLAVFTTQDPTAIGFALRDYVDAAPPPAPIAGSLEPGSGAMGVLEVVGRYGPVPIFQDGVVPYETTGGAIDLDATGAPVVHGTYEARVSITVPQATTMPAEGFPVVLYSHGTGGNYRSFIADGTATRLGAEGYAVMGIDQIHHGARNPRADLSPEILFFNIGNPDAVRYNTLESAIDIVSQARFAATVTIPSTALMVPGGPVHFDPDRIYFFGHSQGGLVGPLFLGLDDGVRGGVVSAGGAILAYALLEKVQPLSIPEVVRAALELPGGSAMTAFAAEGFDFEHPVITLLQGWIEPSEPSNYGRLAFDRPRAGYAPKSILSTEGLMDEYVSPPSIEALAVSMRVPLLEPVSRAIPVYDFLGIATMGPEVTGNVAGGMATAGLLQYPDQGHFAVFRDDVARARIAGFFRSLRSGGPGTIPAPP